MMLKRLASIILCLGVIACASEPILIEDEEHQSPSDVYFSAQWDHIKSPTRKPSQVYGFYTHGCFDGGQALAVEGKGHYLVRAQRGRVYGHPSLIAFLNEFSNAHYEQTREKILISDLSQPRGGPPSLRSKHLSHQSGLDVDIWYRRAASFEHPPSVNPISVLDFSKEQLGEGWTDSHAEVLKNVAAYTQVERVLVTPRVKERLCDLYPGQAWLNKIRPWWGHTHHYHVRLRCPKNSQYCQSQAPVAPYLGCGDDLQWWFSEEAKEAAKKEVKRPEKIRLPKQCYRVYHTNP